MTREGRFFYVFGNLSRHARTIRLSTTSPTATAATAATAATVTTSPAERGSLRIRAKKKKEKESETRQFEGLLKTFETNRISVRKSRSRRRRCGRSVVMHNHLPRKAVVAARRGIILTCKSKIVD